MLIVYNSYYVLLANSSHLIIPYGIDMIKLLLDYLAVIFNIRVSCSLL